MFYNMSYILSGGSVIKNPPAEDTVLIPGPGRFPGEGNGNLVLVAKTQYWQKKKKVLYFCLGNPMDTVHGSQTVGHSLEATR